MNWIRFILLGVLAFTVLTLGSEVLYSYTLPLIGRILLSTAIAGIVSLLFGRR